MDGKTDGQMVIRKVKMKFTAQVRLKKTQPCHNNQQVQFNACSSTFVFKQITSKYMYMYVTNF